MNKWLINGLDITNSLAALALILGGAFYAGHYGWENGYIYSTEYRLGFLYGVMGGIAGAIAAFIVCGLLSTLIEIEKHLRKIAQMPLVRIPDKKHADE